MKTILRPKLTKYIPQTPTAKQAAFLWLPVQDAFFGGSAGPGKSSALLMAALQYVDVPGYNAILLRDTYANLSRPGSLMARAEEWLAGTDARWKGTNNQWVFPSGAVLAFGYLDGPRSHFNYQGSDWSFVGIDEMVGVRERQALYMFSRLRQLEPEAYRNYLKTLPRFEKLTSDQIESFYQQYKKIPLRFRGASNPPAFEQIARGAWVKERYVNPTTRKKGAIFIPAGIADNPHINREDYIKSLMNLDPVTRRQLLDGDWEIRQKGRMFDRSWFEIVDTAPAEGRRVRYWDLAATEKRDDNNPAFSAGVRMTEKHGVYYVESVVRGRKSPRHVEQMVRQIADTDGRQVRIRMEQEPGSGGVNTIDHYRRNVLPEFDFKGIKKTTSKEHDAAPFSSQAEAGNVKLVRGPWNLEFLEEAELFPDGQFKDQIDAASGAFLELALVPVARIRSI